MMAALTRLRPSSVVQRMEEVSVSDEEDETPTVNVGGKYPVVKADDPWNDEKALTEHCLTYCGGGEKFIWVKLAFVVGAPPPELGHGTQLAKVTPTGKAKGKGKGGGGKQGSAKDEVRWQKFQQCMTTVISKDYSHVKGQSAYQKAQKIVKDYDGPTPKWW
jgi:hypothetical protein